MLYMQPQLSFLMFFEQRLLQAATKFAFMAEKVPSIVGPLVGFFNVVCRHIPLDMIESSDF
jgi:hypothetical protein